MQSNKASNKTRKIADETVAAAPETKAPAEATANSRTPRSSKPKSETGDVVAAKRHRKAASPAVQQPVETIETAPAVKTLSAAAGAGSESAIAAVIDPVGVVSPAVAKNSEQTPVRTVVRPQATHQQIAQLAHSYWVARGCPHGSHEEDWLRAEHELTGNR